MATLVWDVALLFAAAGRWLWRGARWASALVRRSEPVTQDEIDDWGIR